MPLSRNTTMTIEADVDSTLGAAVVGAAVVGAAVVGAAVVSGVPSGLQAFLGSIP